MRIGLLRGLNGQPNSPSLLVMAFCGALEESKLEADFEASKLKDSARFWRICLLVCRTTLAASAIAASLEVWVMRLEEG